MDYPNPRHKNPPEGMPRPAESIPEEVCLGELSPLRHRICYNTRTDLRMNRSLEARKLHAGRAAAVDVGNDVDSASVDASALAAPRATFRFGGASP